MKTVAIFGSGPSALLCAWATEQAGHRPHIISESYKSEIPGSQHLHGPVPGLTSQYPEGTIQFVRLGTAEGYAKKVYEDPERQTGWENYRQVFPSWNVVTAYDKLWRHYMGPVDNGYKIHRRDSVFLTEERISGQDHERLNEIVNGHDMVISTVPAQVLCHQQHSFISVPYYIEKLPTPPADQHHEIVVYNGLPDDPWYRWSILGGLCSIEYAHRPGFRDEVGGWHDPSGLIEGQKAINNDCDCWPTIHRCGRWAEWRHGTTMHKAYLKAVQLVEAL